jgi:hypothetical protein
MVPAVIKTKVEQAMATKDNRGSSKVTVKCISRKLAAQAAGRKVSTDRAGVPLGAAAAEATQAVFEALIEPYLAKLATERRARAAGHVVEADFCLRQLTFFEIAMDLAARSGGAIGVEQLRAACDAGEFALEDIAESPMSALLAAARRALWVEVGAMPRPEPTAEKLLLRDPLTGLAIEPAEMISGGDDQLRQQQALQERHRAAARAQAAWEQGLSAPDAENDGPS